MKSPFTAQNNNQFFNSPSSPSSSKPFTTTTTTTFTTNPLKNNHQNTNSSTITNSYEALDLRRSLSPVGGGGSDSVPGFTTFSSVSDESPHHHLNWNENHHQQQQTPLLPSEDWDSMIWDLGNTFKVDDNKINILPQFGPFYEPNHHSSPPLPPPQFPTSSDNPPFNSSFPVVKTEIHPNHHQNHNNFHPGGVVVVDPIDNNNNLEFDCSQLDQLIRAAESVELNDLHLSQMILARLNQTLQNPFGKPLQRTAYYFKEALQNYLNLNLTCNVLSSPSDIVQKIRAYKIFSEISPIPLFANFTANQALLEASDGAMFIHIIDFDIGLGGQWASYMQAIVCKSKSRDFSLPSIRITAIVPEESSLEANLIRENLQQFARELGIRFQLEFVLYNSFELLLFGSIRFNHGEMIAVNLSPSIFRLLSASDSITGFFRFLRRISPQIVVFVDNETCKDTTENSSFRKNFVNGLEFYSALLESLDAANSSDVNLVRRIEKFLIRPKIQTTVTAGRNCISPWRELLSGAGMMPVALSEFTESQADWLVRRTNIRGFHVAKRQGSMLLCWHERELVSTSAWMC
ncbi:hypothetical protein MKW92_027555 [Papaver armeniacum]|nr:hypothetical protein MKW92_027555 [Papaver armeniacum]